MRNKYAVNHVLLRDGVFYYVRRVPLDLAEQYSVKRLCFRSVRMILYLDDKIFRLDQDAQKTKIRFF